MEPVAKQREADGPSEANPEAPEVDRKQNGSNTGKQTKQRSKLRKHFETSRFWVIGDFDSRTVSFRMLQGKAEQKVGIQEN